MVELFDAHAHFMTADFARYPLREAPSQAGPENPAAVGLRERVVASPNTAEQVLSWWDVHGVRAGAAVHYRTAYGLDNRYTLDCAARFPDRIFAVVVQDAQDPGTPARLRTMAATHGLAGVRLTGFVADPALPWLHSPTALRTWAAADDLGLAVVLMHVPPGRDDRVPGAVAELAASYPNTRIVLDHVGWPEPETGPDHGLPPALRTLARFQNVFVKVTSVNFERLREAGLPLDAFVAHVVGVFGADRVLWGSDTGNTPGSYDELVADALAATEGLTAAERAAVLGGTGRAVFVRRHGNSASRERDQT